jgi:hypothetical protein
MVKRMLFLVVLLSFILLSCVPNEVDDITLPEPEESPEEEVLPPSLTEEVIEPQNNILQKDLSPAIAELIAKTQGLKNYQYNYLPRARNNNQQMVDGKIFEVLIRDHLIKKIYPTPQNFEAGWFYDTVYLDTVKETAVGVCSNDQSVLCEGILTQAYTLSFDAEKLTITPLELVGALDTATEVTSVVINNRKALVIEYTNKHGQIERLSLDTYYGIPLKQEIFITEDSKVAIVSNSFSRPVLNNVKSSDVTLPTRYLKGLNLSSSG